MKYVTKIAAMIGLMLFSLISPADEVLYWMLDNPTITDWLGTEYNLADRSTTVSGKDMTFARVAAFQDKAGDQSYAQTRLDGGFSGEGDIVYLDLYYKKDGSWVIDNPTGQGRDTVMITAGGQVVPYQRASVAASLTTAIPGVDWTTYSFAVELGTWDATSGDWVLAAISGTETYGALTDYISQQLDLPDATRWTPGAFSAPEPTSGLLTLIGLALLGLKRKKVRGCQNRGRDVPVASKGVETSLS